MERKTHELKLNLSCPPAVRALLLCFSEAGVGAYPVGGCVRDALMGLAPHDWDVAVTSLPETTMEICRAFGYRVVPTGLVHGTVTVLTDDGPVECTTCRTEGGYSDGRHPDGVSFTGRLSDDLSRRDFTVNAMAAELSSDGVSFSVIDLFGGREDLENKIIRCVGEAEVRLTEDALRILRGVRFAVRLGFDIAEDTFAALKSCGHGLARISRERVSMEFQKILCSTAPLRGLSLLEELNLMQYVLPAGMSCEGAGDLEKLPADFAVRLSSLFWQMSSDDVDTNLHSLRLSNETVQAVHRMTALSGDPQKLPCDGYTARCLRRDYGVFAVPRLMIAEAHGKDTAALRGEVERSEETGECVRISELAVNGRDLIALGLSAGATVGRMLTDLLALVIREPEANTRERLINEVKKRIS